MSPKPKSNQIFGDLNRHSFFLKNEMKKILPISMNSKITFDL